jgi:hypothetical protein
MSLEQLQTSLSALIKSRRISPQENDDYIAKIQSSDNLLLVKKIALWWRKTQIEQYCILTTNLLKEMGTFEIQLSNFFSAKEFSAFREEVGIQFLEYIISQNIDSLTQSVSEFELAIIKLKLGENVETSIAWEYEPYSVVRRLLQNSQNLQELNSGRYQVTVSFKNIEELFSVKVMN